MPRQNAAFTTVLLDIRKLTVLLARADATVLRTNCLPGRQILHAFVGKPHSYHSDKSLPRLNAFTIVPGKWIVTMDGLEIVVPCCLELEWDLSREARGQSPRSKTLTAVV